MVKPMQNSAQVTRKKNDWVRENEGDGYDQEESFVIELRWLAIQSHSSSKKPGKRVQAQKVKNVLGGKGQPEADCTQVIPPARTLSRTGLLGPAVKVASQNGEEGERGFLFGEPIQCHSQR